MIRDHLYIYLSRNNSKQSLLLFGILSQDLLSFIFRLSYFIQIIFCLLNLFIRKIIVNFWMLFVFLRFFYLFNFFYCLKLLRSVLRCRSSCLKFYILLNFCCFRFRSFPPRLIIFWLLFFWVCVGIRLYTNFLQNLADIFHFTHLYLFRFDGIGFASV